MTNEFAKRLDILLGQLVEEGGLYEAESISEKMGIDPDEYRMYFQHMIDEHLAFSQFSNLIPLMKTLEADSLLSRGGFKERRIKRQRQEEARQLIEHLTIRQLKSVVFVGRFGLFFTFLSLSVALVSLLISVLLNWSVIVALFSR